MVEAFDPYHKWLGIPPEEQPGNYYRLLAIRPFEGDPDVIEAAANQRMAHLRTYQTGSHGALSQKLLNEVARAKVCLLRPEHKAAYDAELRRLMEAATRGEDTSSQEQLLRELGEFAAEKALHPSTRRADSGLPIGALVFGAVALLGVGAVAIVLLSKPGGTGVSPVIVKNDTGKMPVLPVAAKTVNAKTESEAKPAEKQIERQGTPGLTPGARPMTPGARPMTPEAGVVSAPPPPVPAPQPPVPKPQPAAPAPKPAAPVAPPPALLPVPDEASQEQAMKVAQDLYRADYEKAKTAAGKLSLARKLIEQAAAKELTAAERFVLLRLAKDIAVRAENYDLAAEAVDRLADGFEIDGLAMKAETLELLARSARGQAGHKALAEQAASLAGTALEAEKLDAAAALAKLAQAEAGKARDKQTVLQARTLAKEVQEAKKTFDEAQTAVATLKERPDDPDANLVRGRYLCLVRGDWTRGLPHLAKGSHAGLTDAATKDIAKPSDAAEQLALAEKWLRLAESISGPSPKDRLRARAIFWCDRAKPKLDDLARNRGEKLFGSLKVPESMLIPEEIDLGIADPDAVPVGEVRKYHSPGHSVTSLTVSQDWRLIAATGNQQVMAWELSSGRQVMRTNVEENLISVAISPDNTLVFCGSTNLLLSLDVNTQRVKERVPVKGNVLGLCFLSGRRTLLAAMGTNGVWLWDAQANQPLRQFVNSRFCEGMSLSRGGRFLVTGSTDKTVTLWDVNSGREIARTQAQSDCVRSVAIFPDNRRALSAGDDKMVRVWDLAKGRQLLRMEGHQATIYGLDVARNGRIALSGSYDKTVRLWDVENGREQARWQFDDTVRAVSFLPDNRFALIGAGGWVRLYRLPINKAGRAVRVADGGKVP